MRSLYGRMQADLDSRSKYEKSLIDKARVLSDELDNQRNQLAQCDEDELPQAATGGGKDGQAGKSSEVVLLRNKLMKQMNELAMKEEKSQEDTYGTVLAAKSFIKYQIFFIYTL